MANQTGGDFCGGLPPAERELLSGGGHKRDPNHCASGGDTSHLSNARAVRHSPEPVDAFRPGWRPNLNNPKGE